MSDAFDMSAALDALGTTGTVVEAAGIPFHARTWGDAGQPLLLVHGVGASSAIWWRVGPALAVEGYRVVAPDLPGHGRTGHWNGRHSFRETATELLAFIRAAGLDLPDLAVVGHSWGAMTVAELPRLRLRPAIIVLVDPPAIPATGLLSMLNDPAERHYDDLAEAIATIRHRQPSWSPGDVAAKAEALTHVDETAARAVLTENDDWDGGLAALANPGAAEIPIWLIRGDPASGGLIPGDALRAFEARLGAGRIITIEGAPHSPQRTQFEAFLAALLRALSPGRGRGPGSGRG